MANDYASSTDAFGELPESSFSSSDYSNMANYVTVASRLIDAEVGRWDGFFYPTTDDVTRYYTGSGCDEQNIDEFVSITTLSVAESGGYSSSDYTAWSSTDYYTFPFNASVEGKPSYRLIVDEFSSKRGFYSYPKSVKVVGIFGYSATTHPLVAQACRTQAVRWFMRAKGGWQDKVNSESMGELRYQGISKLDGDICAMLHNLKIELDK
jgi:hypothetical protein